MAGNAVEKNSQSSRNHAEDTDFVGMTEAVNRFTSEYCKAGLNLKEFLDCVERHLLIQALNRFDGNQKKTSEFLDLKPTTMNAKCKKHGIKFVKQVI